MQDCGYHIKLNKPAFQMVTQTTHRPFTSSVHVNYLEQGRGNQGDCIHCTGKSGHLSRLSFTDNYMRPTLQQDTI